MRGIRSSRVRCVRMVAGRLGKTSRILAAIGVAVAGVLVNGAGTVAQAEGCAWSQASSPSPGTNRNFLFGVTAVSASDVWAVGNSQSGSAADQTLIEHWNGSSWSQVSSPSPGTNSNSLNGVTAVSASDVWAVGNSQSGSAAFQTLIEHWNGSSWSQVSSPSPGTGLNSLIGVTAVSASDVWAVGISQSGSAADQTLIEHWNGSSWSQVSSPSPGTSRNKLLGVAAVSASDVWAVGNSQSGSAAFQTLIEHWNGSSWSQVSSPSPGTTDNELDGVAAVSASDVWAVGFSRSGSAASLTLIEHWNGSSWSQVSSPSPGTFFSELSGVAAVSASDVWAVGQSQSGSAASQTLIEHWDGSSWSQVSSPSPGNSNNSLNGVTAVSASDVWAVGFSRNGSAADLTLIEHFTCAISPSAAAPATPAPGLPRSGSGQYPGSDRVGLPSLAALLILIGAAFALRRRVGPRH